MQVNVENLSTVKKVLHIEIPEDEVAAEIEEAYKQLRKTAKVKGFRPGKVPRSVLETLYKKNVHAEVSAKLIQESFEEAIRQTEISYIGGPELSPPELDPKAPYKYDAILHLPPQIADIDFKGLSLRKNLYEVTDEDVDKQTEALRKNLGRLQPIEEDRPLGQGDVAVIDLEGFKDGAPFAETPKTENYTMRMGNAQIVKELDDGLMGMSPGEHREISVHFPENYPHKKLSGADITFHIDLKEIREDAQVELNDDFAKFFGKQTLAELQVDIRENLKEGYERRTEQELFEQAYLAMLEKNDFEVPDVLVDHELEGIVRDAEASLVDRGTTIKEQFGTTREEFAERYRETALNQVRRHLLLGKLVEQENLMVSDEDLEAGINDMAKALNKPPEEVKNHYKQKPDELEYFKHALLEKQAMRLVVENSTVEEVHAQAQ